MQMEAHVNMAENVSTLKLAWNANAGKDMVEPYVRVRYGFAFNNSTLRGTASAAEREGQRGQIAPGSQGPGGLINICQNFYLKPL